MKCRLLVGANEFIKAMQADLDTAQDYVYMQVLNFEADQAGCKVAETLRSCEAPDRRLIVDEYIRYMISDRFLYSPRNLRDRRLQDEAHETKALMAQMNRDGIAVRLTNPFGFALSRFPQRNHKKLLLIDDQHTYIGGINVADHNFRWHDLMLRISDERVTSLLREDFLETWTGTSRGGAYRFEGMTLLLCDGRRNEPNFQELFHLIGQARERIWVQSPYLSFPFFQHLRTAADRGVRIDIVAPAENNKPLFDSYTRFEANRPNMHLWLLPPPMTHMKAMLIDHDYLIVGSANFDYLSYRSQQEIIAVITDSGVIEEFVNRVVDIDTQRSARVTTGREFRGLLSSLVLRSIGIPWTWWLRAMPESKRLIRAPVFRPSIRRDGARHDHDD